MYINPNYPTKKAFKEALKAGVPIEVFSLGPFPAKRDGIEYIEGPHSPKPHSWYARVQAEVTKALFLRRPLVLSPP